MYVYELAQELRVCYDMHKKGIEGSVSIERFYDSTSPQIGLAIYIHIHCIYLT